MASQLGGGGPPAEPGAPRRGRLYVVATPIGNLGDITLRALETLRAVALVAAEDTRRTGALLRHFRIDTPLVSYHAHNRVARLPRLLAALAQGDLALVSDAGTPAISDPGQELIAAAGAAGHEIVAVPGPSAPIAALAVSGLSASLFHCAGFLPRRASQRRRCLAQMAGWPGTLILFEAPHRLRGTLADLLDVLGDRQVAVCCELTKLFEQVLRTTLAAAAAHFQAVEPRGEFTLVVAGAGTLEQRTPEAPPSARLRQRYAALLSQLGDRKQALRALAAETRLPRKTLYAALLAPDAAGPRASPRKAPP